MSNQPDNAAEFSLTWTQKLTYLAVPVALSLAIVRLSPVFEGWAGKILFIALGAGLGLLTWFISAGWAYRIEIAGGEIRIRDPKGNHTIPLDRVGMIVRNGGRPFPTLWLVLRNYEQGMDMPSRGVDPSTRTLVEAYQRRQPGKKVSIVPVPGGHLRSVSGFIAELKRRVPPMTVDERLAGK